VVLRERVARPGVTARFDRGDAGERGSLSFDAPMAGRTQVAIAHAGIADLASADAAEAAWRDRLATLKSLLEG